MAKSAIEWTNSVWNPVTGCNKVSQGCKNCYADRMAKRLQAMGQPRYRSGFRLTLHEDNLDTPIYWTKPQLIFVNSMSDLFHEKVPLEFIQRVFDTMTYAYWHQYQILTKRAQRLEALNPHLVWPTNVWMGVSVENEDVMFRIDHLRNTAAKLKFLSCEPLLGPMHDLDLHGIDWVIAGGESGPGARSMRREWVIDIRDQCLQAGVPFFFKQWGGVQKSRAGRELEGRTWDELPHAMSAWMSSSSEIESLQGGLFDLIPDVPESAIDVRTNGGSVRTERVEGVCRPRVNRISLRVGGSETNRPCEEIEEIGQAGACPQGARKTGNDRGKRP